jgi:2-ketocyclohexanecarboxyl-CoA hydrolase
MGLCNTVVADERLDAEVRKWCEEILEKSPTALAIAKRSFNAETASIAGISGMGLHEVSMFYTTEESKEGVNAFKEKRKPDFRKYQK